MLINLKESKSQLILAINKADLDKAEGTKLHAYPSEDIPANLDLGSENIFFTSIDRSSGKLTGYQLGADWVPNKVWQLNVAQGEAETILQVRSQHQTASEIDHQHYIPTSFVGDNLIYKYLDSNLFAVSTLNTEKRILSIYIINGVSGKVAYKFTQADVSLGEPIDMFLSENYFVLAFKRASQSQGGLPQ